jgi:hypothetical protein
MGKYIQNASSTEVWFCCICILLNLDIQFWIGSDDKAHWNSVAESSDQIQFGDMSYVLIGTYIAAIKDNR